MNINIPKLMTQIYHLPEQQIEVIASGENLRLLEENVPIEQRDDEEVMPDLVKLLCQCINYGMFSGNSYHPETSHAKLLHANFSADTNTQHWRFEIKHVDIGVLRVLLNMLSAREVDSLSIHSINANIKSQAKSIDIDNIDYPAHYGSLPFIVEHDTPEFAKDDRILQISFQNELTPQELESIYIILQQWVNLLLLGGFAPDDLPAIRSGTVPDLAFLFDPLTIEQSFSEIFSCDEAAFNAILNWCVKLNPQIKVNKITIS